jgi:hypothetical protein
MSVVKAPAKLLKGLSFDLAELILVQGWSAFHNLRMVVRLDHGSDAEEYEEVLAFHVGTSPLCHWIMWRNAAAVFVQPLVGRSQCYGSVAEALAALTPKQCVVLTDIKPTHWPCQTVPRGGEALKKLEATPVMRDK